MDLHNRYLGGQKNHTKGSSDFKTGPTIGPLDWLKYKRWQKLEFLSRHSGNESNWMFLYAHKYFCALFWDAVKLLGNS